MCRDPSAPTSKTAWAVVIIMFTALATLAAKGPTRRVTLSGPGIVGVHDVNDRAALANVWAGDFIGEPTTKPDRSLPRYLVEFFVQPPRERVQMMYTITYVRDPRTGDGYVYLPGRGEPGWKRNVQTILRDGLDGTWRHASSEWNRGMSAGLARAHQR
jgi:hypothetical protein